MTGRRAAKIDEEEWRAIRAERQLEIFGVPLSTWASVIVNIPREGTVHPARHVVEAVRAHVNVELEQRRPGPIVNHSGTPKISNCLSARIALHSSSSIFAARRPVMSFHQRRTQRLHIDAVAVYSVQASRCPQDIIA